MAEAKRHQPVTVSWSSIRMAEECKQKSWLYRTGRRNPAQDIRQFFHGTVVDRVMRTWLTAPDPQPGEMPQMVRDIVDQEELLAIATGDGVVKWKNKSDREQMTLWCMELVTRLEPLLYKHVLPYEYEPAKRFRVPVQVPWLDGSPTWAYLAGEMDLLVRDDNQKFVVWDLKGTADNGYWRKVVGQLIFYDIATQAMFGDYCDKTGLIQPMCKEPILEFRFTENDYRGMWVRIHRYMQNIWLKDNEPKLDSVGCAYCGVRHACSRFKPVNPETGARRMSLQGMQQLGDELSVLEDLESEE